MWNVRSIWTCRLIKTYLQIEHLFKSTDGFISNILHSNTTSFIMIYFDWQYEACKNVLNIFLNHYAISNWLNNVTFSKHANSMNTRYKTFPFCFSCVIMALFYKELGNYSELKKSTKTIILNVITVHIIHLISQCIIKFQMDKILFNYNYNTQENCHNQTWCF